MFFFLKGRQKFEEQCIGFHLCWFFRYDPHWLAIMRSTNQFLSLGLHQMPLPAPMSQQQRQWKRQGLNNGGGGVEARTDFSPTEDELGWVRAKWASENSGEEEGDGMKIPLNFTKTAPCYDPKEGTRGNPAPASYSSNPQTAALLKFLETPDLITEKVTSSLHSNAQIVSYSSSLVWPTTKQHAQRSLVGAPSCRVGCESNQQRP